MNFHYNEQLDEVLLRFYDTYSLTNGTADYVPETSMKLIDKQIDRAMRTAFKTVEKEDKAYQKALRKKERRQRRKEFWAKVGAFFTRKKVQEVQSVAQENAVGDQPEDDPSSPILSHDEVVPPSEPCSPSQEPSSSSCG